jgi:hypothetical protein
MTAFSANHYLVAFANGRQAEAWLHRDNGVVHADWAMRLASMRRTGTDGLGVGTRESEVGPLFGSMREHESAGEALVNLVRELSQRHGEVLAVLPMGLRPERRLQVVR